jgi:hypothetical protein
VVGHFNGVDRSVLNIAARIARPGVLVVAMALLFQGFREPA